MKDAVIQKQLSDAILRGDSQTAETKAKIIAQYAEDPTEALDDLYDAFRTAETLRALGEYDQARFAASCGAARVSLGILRASLVPKQTRFTARVCIGPVSGGGDVMSAIMAALLSAAGHEVVDLSKSTTPRELLRNAEQSNAELLIVSINEQTVAIVNEFVNEYESGGFRNKYGVIAFARGSQIPEPVLSSFVLVAHEPLELLSKTTELMIRKQGSDRTRRSE